MYACARHHKQGRSSVLSVTDSTKFGPNQGRPHGLVLDSYFSVTFRFGLALRKQRSLFGEGKASLGS